MKTISNILLGVGVIALGLVGGTAVAEWRFSGAPRKAASVSGSLGKGSSKLDSNWRIRGNSGKSSTYRWSRLALVMDQSALGGPQSLAKAWRESEGDPALREWLSDLWRRQDPAAFLRLLCQEDRGDPEAGSIRMSAEQDRLLSVVAQLTAQDPNAALRIAEDQKRPQLRWRMISQLVFSLLESDPGRGLQVAAAHPDVRLDGNAYSDKLKLTPQDVPALLSLSTSTETGRLLARAMTELPGAEAMKILTNSTPTNKRLGLIAVAERWVQEDADAALQYATTEAAQGERLAILRVLGRKKVDENPAAGAAWAKENLFGYERVNALSRAARLLEKTDPAAAAAIRASLPDHYNPKRK